MSSFQRKVLSEIFLDPTVVLPVVAGLSSWLVSWAAGGIRSLTLAGLVGVLGGIGWLATRVIFQVESIAQRVQREEQEALLKQENARLDALYQELLKDRDPRPEDYLTLLRNAKHEFEGVVKQPGVEGRSASVVGQVRHLFQAAVVQLERSQQLWDLSQRLRGQDRQDVVEEREKVLAEVKESVDHLHSVTRHYRQLMLREQQSDLTSLREELEASLRVAKRTEERMREFESNSNYENYTKE